jgi:hypothetical protein
MKKYLFGIFAIALAVAFSAFKTATFDSVYKYVGPVNGSFDIDNPAYWQRLASISSLSDCESGSDAVCSFVAPDNLIIGGGDNHIRSNVTLTFSADNDLSEIRDFAGGGAGVSVSFSSEQLGDKP